SWELCYRMPELESVCALADFFGVSLDYLLGRSDDPAITKPSDSSVLSPVALVFYARLNSLPARAREKVLRELEWWERYMADSRGRRENKE
ncbi:MAG: hypothetical protein ACPLRM_01225, partial [Anaerolineae bacterium]